MRRVQSGRLRAAELQVWIVTGCTNLRALLSGCALAKVICSVCFEAVYDPLVALTLGMFCCNFTSRVEYGMLRFHCMSRHWIPRCFTAAFVDAWSANSPSVYPRELHEMLPDRPCSYADLQFYFYPPLAACVFSNTLHLASAVASLQVLHYLISLHCTLPGAFSISCTIFRFINAVLQKLQSLLAFVLVQCQNFMDNDIRYC